MADHPTLATPIDAQEHRARRERMLAHADAQGVDAQVWWGNHRVM